MGMLEERLRRAADSMPFVRPLHDLATRDPVKALEAVARLRTVIDDAETLAVIRARAERLGWREIAEVMGCHHDTVHANYRHVDPLEGRRGRPRRWATVA